MRKFWTIEEIEQLKNLYEVKGLYSREIVHIMNRSLNSIEVKKNKLGLKHTKEQKFQCHSRASTGENNGMFKKGYLIKGHEVSEETKKKISKTNKENYKSGKVKPSMLGRTHSIETKQLLSDNMKGNKYTLGRKLTKEQKQHLSNCAKKQWKNATPEYKKRHAKLSSDRMKANLEKYGDYGFTNWMPNIGKNEKKYLDQLEDTIGYKIERQYPIWAYFVDGYIPELNLVIEIDENCHKWASKYQKSDKRREAHIKKMTGCEFMRIQDNESEVLEYAFS